MQNSLLLLVSFLIVISIQYYFFAHYITYQNMQINQYQGLLTKCEYVQAICDSIIKNIQTEEQLNLFSKLNINKSFYQDHELKLLQQKENQLNTIIMKYQQLELKQKNTQQDYQFQIQQAYLKIRKLKQQKNQIGKIKHQKIIQNKTFVRMAKQIKELQKQLHNERKLLNLQIKNNNSLKQNNLQILQSIDKAQNRQVQMKKNQQIVIQTEKQHIHFKELQDRYTKLAEQKQKLLFQSTQSLQQINSECQRKVNQMGDMLRYDQEMDEYISKLFAKIKEQEFIIQEIEKREMQKLLQFPQNQIVQQQSEDDEYFRHQVQNLRKTIANRKFNQRVKLFDQQKLISFAKGNFDVGIDNKSEYSNLEKPKSKKFSHDNRNCNHHNNQNRNHYEQGQNQLNYYQPERFSRNFQVQKRNRHAQQQTPKSKYIQNHNQKQIFKISVEPVSHSKKIYNNYNYQNVERAQKRHSRPYDQQKNVKINVKTSPQTQNSRMKQQQHQVKLKKRKQDFLQNRSQNLAKLQRQKQLSINELNYIRSLIQKKEESLMKLSKLQQTSPIKPMKYSRINTESQQRKMTPKNYRNMKNRIATEPITIKYKPYNIITDKPISKNTKANGKYTSSDLFGDNSQIMDKLKSRIRIRTRQTEQQKQKEAQQVKKRYISEKSQRNHKNRNSVQIANVLKHQDDQNIHSFRHESQMSQKLQNGHSMALNSKIKQIYTQKLQSSKKTSPNTTTSNMKMMKYKSRVDDINSEDDKIQSLLAQLKKLKQQKLKPHKTEEQIPNRVSSQRSKQNDQKIQVYKFSKNRKSRIKSAFNNQKGSVQQRESGSQQQQQQQQNMQQKQKSLYKIQEVDESFKNTINNN